MLSLMRQIFATVLIVCLTSIAAIAADWQVERTTAGVNYTVDRKTWFPAHTGLVVPNGSWISTGPRGRLTMVRGGERLSFHPRTLAAVVTSEGFLSRKTEVVQQKGQIALDIEKRGRPHTFVQTPFLAAVVKGTSFTVTVTDRNASVSVDRGLVQVSSFTGGQSTDVGPGQQATVDQAQTMTVAGNTSPPSVVSVEPTRAAVPAVGQPAPIGAGLGLSGFSARSSAGDTGSGSPGVNGESSEGGHAAVGNGRGNQGDSNESAGRGNGRNNNGSGGAGIGNSGVGAGGGATLGAGGGAGNGSDQGSGQGNGNGQDNDDDDDDDDDDD